MAFNITIRAATKTQAEEQAIAALGEQTELSSDPGRLDAAIEILQLYLDLAEEPRPGRAIVVNLFGSKWLQDDPDDDQPAILGGVGGGINISYGHIDGDTVDVIDASQDGHSMLGLRSLPDQAEA